MKIFENAQVGDLVYCRLKGNGIIKSTTYSERYPLECSFDNNNHSPFDYDGRSQKDHIEPTLFYRKGSEKYLTERPEPEIDWSKVPSGTKVQVSDSYDDLYRQPAACLLGYFPNMNLNFWVYINKDDESSNGFKYCKLAEPCKPEWIKKD